MRPFDYAAFGAAGEALETNGRRLGRVVAQGFRPPERITLSAWAEKHRRFGDDAPYPGPWKNATAPYLVEIMDRLSPFDPASEVSIKKCSQSGGSAAGENWIGYAADVVPGPMMYVQATLPAAFDWARNKLWPMIRATPRLNPARRGAIKDLEAKGSTKGQIDFARGGYLLLAGANSAASLTQKTVRFVIEDDLDQFPDDLEGQGSPEAMVDSRIKVFRNRGLSKRLKIGTPTVKGASKIAAAYARSDQRRFYFACPACEARFDPTWEHADGGARDIQWPDGEPERAYLVAPCCGSVIEHWQKLGMIREDGWVPTVEIDGVKPPRVIPTAEAFRAWRERDVGGREPGYHITGIVTVFDNWGELARKFVAAAGDPNKLKGWVMLDLGEEFEVRGEAPDHEKLAKLIEAHFGRGRRLPVGPVATTIGCDVQADGIYFTLIAWGPRSETWTIEAAFLPGATDVEGEGAWAELEKVVRRPVVYPGGQPLPVDQVVVDAGFHTKAATAFCRGHANRLAVFGRAGWTLPVLGRGEAQRYEAQGARAGHASKRPEDRAYLVGTFGVKSTIYGFLRKTVQAFEAALAGERLDPHGLCHFGEGLPEDYFEQVTAETIETKVVNGYPRREWRPIKSRPNHYLDCRVYAHAGAEKLMLDSLTEAQWSELRAKRYAEPVGQADLFAQPLAAEAAAAPPPASDANAVRAPASPAAGREGDWINSGGDWL